MLSIFWPADVSMLTYFESVPNLPRRSTPSEIVPLSFGASVQGTGGCCAWVQPQEGLTQLIVTFALETFVTEKLKGAFSSPAFAVYSLWEESQARMLSPTVDGAL